MSDPAGGCGSPPPMMNSIVTDCRPKILGPGVHIEGTKCYAECNPGYHLSDGDTEYTITCQAGEWVQTEICNADCPSPSLTNSTIAECTRQGGPPYLEGTSCTVRCNQDYQLTNSDTEHSIACLGGEWQGVQHCKLTRSVTSADTQTIIIVIFLVILFIIATILLIIYIMNKKCRNRLPKLLRCRDKHPPETPPLESMNMEDVDAKPPSATPTNNGLSDVYIDQSSPVRTDTEEYPLMTESDSPGRTTQTSAHNISNRSTNVGSTLRVLSIDGSFYFEGRVIRKNVIDQSEVEFITKEYDNTSYIAVRRIQVSSESVRSKCKDELDMVKTLKHDNIVKYYNIWPVDNDKVFEIYARIEMCEDDLKTWLQRKSHPDRRHEGLNLLRQVVIGVDFIHHKQDYVHGNLKPDSIYISHGTPKIGNFGYVRYIANDIEWTPEEENINQYMSPEQLGGQDYEKHHDIYALGMICFEMLDPEAYGNLSIVSYILGKDDDTAKNVTAKDILEGNWLSEIREKCSNRLVEKMLGTEPEKRPATKDILMDELFRSQFN